MSLVLHFKIDSSTFEYNLISSLCVGENATGMRYVKVVGITTHLRCKYVQDNGCPADAFTGHKFRIRRRSVDFRDLFQTDGTERCASLPVKFIMAFS